MQPNRSMRRAFVCALTIALVLPASASANAVLEDWRADGSIDGNYTVQELKAAKGASSAEELEYSDFGFAVDKAIAQSLRRSTKAKSSSTATTRTGPNTVRATSVGGSTSSSKSDTAKAKSSKSQDGAAASDELTEGSLSAKEASGSAGSSESDGGSNLLWIALGAFVVAGAASGGGWYFMRRRNGQSGPGN